MRDWVLLVLWVSLWISLILLNIFQTDLPITRNILKINSYSLRRIDSAAASDESQQK